MRTVLITGGGTGIGAELSRLYAEAGDEVLICGRRLDVLQAAASKHRNIHAYRCDLTDPEQIASMVASIRADGHQVDTLINNAAIMSVTTVAEPIDRQALDRDVRANLIGPMLLVDALLPTLRAAKDPMVANVNSPVSLVPLADVAFYAITKAALHAYTDCLRWTLSPDVRVVEVFPPTVDTPMAQSMQGRPKMSAEQCASKIYAGLATGRDEVWVGEGVALRWLSKIAPRKWLLKLVNGQVNYQQP